jgi:hypothetical protein
VELRDAKYISKQTVPNLIVYIVLVFMKREECKKSFVRSWRMGQMASLT